MERGRGMASLTRAELQTQSSVGGAQGGVNAQGWGLTGGGGAGTGPWMGGGIFGVWGWGWGGEGAELRPFVVITPSILLPLLLQVLQFGFVHHLLHQVLLPPHAIAEVLRHVWDEVRDEGLDPKHQMLRGTVNIDQIPSTLCHFTNKQTHTHAHGTKALSGEKIWTFSGWV